MPSLDIIIVNWNSGDQLYACLQSIMMADLREFILAKVIIVDNASSDRSLLGLDSLELPLTIIRNGENRGFAAACNEGARKSNGDYLLFLNPDTRVSRDALYQPMKFLEEQRNSSIGICGIRQIDESGRTGVSCSRFPTVRYFLGKATGLSNACPGCFKARHMKHHELLTSGVVDQVIGAFFMVRCKIFRELRGFDEAFFVYYEEVDFSVRARACGCLSYYLGTVSSYHRGGGCSEQVGATRLFYSLRSRILYCFKHYGGTAASCILFVTLFVEPFARIGYLVSKNSMSGLKETLVGFSMLFKDAPNWLQIIRGNV